MQTIQKELTQKALQAVALVSGVISKSPTGVSFFSVKDYTNKDGETSDYVFNVGASYEKAKAKDIEFLRNLDITKRTFKSTSVEIEKARTTLIEAFINPNERISTGQKDAYTSIIPGVKVHNETGYLYLYGYLLSKVVKVKGTYKTVNSSAETIAKNELRKLLRTSKFRQFSIEVGNTLKGNGRTIEL